VSGARSDGHAEPLPERRAAKGLAAFFVLTIVGLVILFTATTRDAGGWVAPTLHGGILALAAASAALDIIIGALRYHLFIRKIRPGTSLWLPIRADLANRFVGAVTPSQTGGGPAQVFVLRRGGVPVPEALSFLAVNFLCTLVVLLAGGGAAAWALGDRVPAGVATHLVRYGGTVLLAGLGLILFALGRPDTCARILERGATRLERIPAVWASALARAARTLAGGTDRYRATCARFLREEPVLPLAALFLTLLLYLNKYTLAWLVMRGLGADGAYSTGQWDRGAGHRHSHGGGPPRWAPGSVHSRIPRSPALRPGDGGGRRPRRRAQAAPDRRLLPVPPRRGTEVGGDGAKTRKGVRSLRSKP
jgi:hypothetical protein